MSGPPPNSWRSHQFDHPPASGRHILSRSVPRLLRIIRDSIDTAESERRGHESSSLRRRRRSPSEPMEDTLPPISTDREHISQSARRRSKRRKLPDPQPFQNPKKYGRAGQVDPGRLSMDLISCDGGEHKDDRYPQAYLGSKNVLRNDQSVYCSEGPCTSILLKHSDDTAFSLDRVYIIAPQHGFTSPVRAGEVFIAMNMADLHKYQDNHRGAQSPARLRPIIANGLRESPERLSVAEALRDPEISAALYTARYQTARPSAVEFGLNDLQQPPLDDPATPCDETSLSDDDYMSADNAEVGATILEDSDVPGPEDDSTPAVLEYRNQRRRLMQRRRNYNSLRNDRRQEYSSRRPPQLEDDAATPLRPNADSPKADAGGYRCHPIAIPDPQVTRAFFYIRRTRHQVAIQFDPPISGRFILLKMWSAAGPDATDRNVDVQSVLVQGWGAWRYFPSLEPR